MQASWFPTYTLGEDMALALEVQKAGWKGAYVKVSPHLTGGIFTCVCMHWCWSGVTATLAEQCA